MWFTAIMLLVLLFFFGSAALRPDLHIKYQKKIARLNRWPSQEYWDNPMWLWWGRVVGILGSTFLVAALLVGFVRLVSG
jgi:hypothetical protein